MLRVARALAAAIVAAGAYIFVVGVADASAASLFLCVPTTAGQAAVSGGSSASRLRVRNGCRRHRNPVARVLHGQRRRRQADDHFHRRVNVQVVSGSGSTSGAVNGEGNLIVGYAENTSGHAQTGSNDLIVGSENGWKSYGEIVGGFKNQASGKYATAVGDDNSAAGAYSLTAGEVNKASGSASTAIAVSTTWPRATGRTSAAASSTSPRIRSPRSAAAAMESPAPPPP